jgi:hypothetical protein
VWMHLGDNFEDSEPVEPRFEGRFEKADWWSHGYKYYIVREHEGREASRSVVHGPMSAPIHCGRGSQEWDQREDHRWSSSMKYEAHLPYISKEEGKINFDKTY